ncbi:MAG: hypothetical protein IT260_17320 [Saprospiraceae bacterium]|nr:hypothetical protein [Saprospiraceae bacterium]
MPAKNTVKVLLLLGLMGWCSAAGRAQAPLELASPALYVPFKPALLKPGLFRWISPPAKAMPPDLRACAWQADALPLFCKIEYHFEIRKKVPFKFRLGSVDYVDWLEGKPGYSTLMYR